MATRIYSVSPGENIVTEGVGSPTASKVVEVTVDLATTTVHMGAASTRAITKAEVLEALDAIKQHILEGKWLPA